FPSRLCANSPSVSSISLSLLSTLAICADAPSNNCEVDARSIRLVSSSSVTFTNPESFFCCSASVAILAFCASTAARIEVNTSIVSGLPGCCGDPLGAFCCFSLSSAALMFLLLLLLVIVEERLRAARSEVRRERTRALAALGAPGLAPAVLDVERPRLLADVLPALAHGGVQTPTPHPLTVVLLLVLLLDHRDHTGLVHRAGIGQGGAHPVAHLAIERPLSEVLATQFPVLRRVLQRLHDREPVIAHQLVVRGLHAALVPGLAVVERPVVREPLSRLVVVVDDEDVVVGLAAPPIGVGHHEAVSARVHPLREHVAQIVHPLHVLRILRVELLVAERLPVVQRLDVALRVLGQRPGVRRERAGAARHVARDRDPALVLLASDVALGVRGAGARTVVRSAHEAVRSPSRARTSRRSSISSGTSADSATGSPARARRSRSLTLIASGRTWVASSRASADACTRDSNPSWCAAPAACSASRTTPRTQVLGASPSRSARARSATSVA